MRFGIWRFAVAPSNATSKNSNIGAQLQTQRCILAPKLFWKIYFLYDLVRINKLVHSEPFLDYLYKVWQLLSAICNVMRKFFLYRCTSTFSALNYCSEFSSNLSAIYTKWCACTNFSADFWTFRNFGRQFRENCGASQQRKWELCSAPERM